MSKKDDVEKYNFFATILTPHETVKRVLCRLWLPPRMTDPIRMVFYPTQRQADHHFHQPNPFSVYGRIVGLPGNAITIRTSEAWVSVLPTRSLSKTRRETVFEADPIDLQIFTSSRAERKKAGALNTSINYVLTPSPRELTPFTMRTFMGNGAIRVRTVGQFAFTLINGRKLNFVERYHHEDRGDEEIMWNELLAKETTAMPRSKFARVDERALTDIDDFLVLTMFASRYPVVCVGIDAYTESGDHFVFYRKNRTVPPSQEQDTNDSVIDISDFRTFIRKAYPLFVRSGANGPDELLRHALNLLTPPEDRTVESEFTTLFAALETLVLWHRRHIGLEWIIENENEWSSFRADIGDFVKQHDLLKNDKDRRKLLRAKLSELRRVPFSAAFESFCATYSVDLHDLWPVVGKTSEMPLSEIRNHIVHGSTFAWSQWLALGDARHHLRWTIERMLLGIFGWSVEKSKVRPHWLARNRMPMIKLESSRRAMRGLPPLPPETATPI